LNDAYFDVFLELNIHRGDEDILDLYMLF